MFMVVIWLQGIWLPLHGYSFERTPLWAGIYMLPTTAGFLGQGVRADVGDQVSHLPPVGSLFAAFLGYTPMKNLLGSVLNTLPAARDSYITGKTFFPQLISDPFMHGLRIVFSAAVVMSLVAAAASWLRGQKYVHAEEEAVAEIPAPVVALAATGVSMPLNSGPTVIQPVI